MDLFGVETLRVFTQLKKAINGSFHRQLTTIVPVIGSGFRSFLPQRIKFMLWTEWHNSTSTMQVLHRRGVSAKSVCQRCGQAEETFIQCPGLCLTCSDVEKAGIPAANIL